MVRIPNFSIQLLKQTFQCVAFSQSFSFTLNISSAVCCGGDGCVYDTQIAIAATLTKTKEVNLYIRFVLEDSTGLEYAQQKSSLHAGN